MLGERPVEGHVRRKGLPGAGSSGRDRRRGMASSAVGFLAGALSQPPLRLAGGLDAAPAPYRAPA